MSTAITGQLITYQNIKDTILLYIKQHCKNIGVIRNDIPVNFDKTHRFIYSLGFKADKSVLFGSKCLTMTYNSKYNQRLKIVPEIVVDKNLQKLFQANNINATKMQNSISSYEDLLRLLLIILKFYSKKILRVYFPLSNNYAYFYDGLSTETENVSYIISPIRLNDDKNVTDFLKSFYSFIIGTDTKDKQTYNLKDLFYSMLYKIDVQNIYVDNYKPSYITNNIMSDNEENNRTLLAKIDRQINIT